MIMYVFVENTATSNKFVNFNMIMDDFVEITRIFNLIMAIKENTKIIRTFNLIMAMLSRTPSTASSHLHRWSTTSRSRTRRARCQDWLGVVGVRAHPLGHPETPGARTGWLLRAPGPAA